MFSRGDPNSKQQKSCGFLRRRPEIITIPLSLIILFGIWEIICKSFNIPTYILPAPSLIGKAFIAGIKTGIYNHHTFVTLKEILLGFGIAVFLGLFFGGLVAQWRLAEKTIYPYLVAIETIPKIALAPIMIVWMGVGIVSKVAIAGLVAFFPILVNTIQGLVLIDENRMDLMRSLGANKWQIFWKLRVPSALPLIFTGLDTASVLCVLGAITGEFVGSRAGLGSLILHYQFMLEIPSFFGVVIILAAIGLIFHGIIRLLQKKIVFWVNLDHIDSV